MGPVEETLSWCSSSFYVCISKMYKVNVSDLNSAFSFGTVLDYETKGIMEVLFAVSCFRSASVEAMGSLFWTFARELIRIQVHDVDYFNLLLWGQTLPQTILVLDPIVFQLDCMIPGIENVISIEGTANSSHGVNDLEGSVRRSTIVVPTNTSMVFFNSVKISGIDVKRFLVPYSPVCERCISMTTPVSCGKLVRMMDVEIFGGGVNMSNYESVCCLGITIHEAKTAVSVKRVKDFFFGSGGRDAPLLDRCELLFMLDGVSKACFEELHFKECRMVFHANVPDLFEVKRVAMTKCDSIGQILMKPGNNPFFYRTMVCLLAVSFCVVV